MTEEQANRIAQLRSRQATPAPSGQRHPAPHPARRARRLAGAAGVATLFGMTGYLVATAAAPTTTTATATTSAATTSAATTAASSTATTATATATATKTVTVATTVTSAAPTTTSSRAVTSSHGS